MVLFLYKRFCALLMWYEGCICGNLQNLIRLRLSDLNVCLLRLSYKNILLFLGSIFIHYPFKTYMHAIGLFSHRGRHRLWISFVSRTCISLVIQACLFLILLTWPFLRLSWSIMGLLYWDPILGFIMGLLYWVPLLGSIIGNLYWGSISGVLGLDLWLGSLVRILGLVP